MSATVTILVSPLSRVDEVVRTRAPESVVSLLDPHHETPDLGYGERHLRITFHECESLIAVAVSAEGDCF